MVIRDKELEALKRPSTFSRKRLFFVLLLLLLLPLSIWLMNGKGDDKEGKKKEKPPVPVVVSEVRKQTVPLQLEAIGNTTPLTSVNVKPQIEGQITRINFKEGQFVKAGELLFVIDPRPLNEALSQANAVVSKDQAQISMAQSIMARDKAQVELAQANMQRDIAQLEFAKAEEQRYSTLYKQEYISLEQYEQMMSNRKTTEQTVKAAQASINNAKAVVQSDLASIETARANLRADQALAENARLKLEYAFIRAPLSGRTGGFLVHIGDSVKVNETNLVSIEQISPIYVAFALPEHQLAEVMSYQKSSSLKVEALTQGGVRKEKQQRVQGKLTFVDNTVNPTTGTIQLKAEFPNIDHELWPGQFVNVVITLAHLADVMVVPSQAIQSGQQGTFVFIENGGIVEYRPVTTGRAVAGLTIIEQGVTPGEHVVIDGQLKLEPKSKVAVKEIR